MKYEDANTYYTLENIDPSQDTLQLITYANQQIKRENSPVKNIVLDLSLNGGGAGDAAVFVISWFLGEAGIAIRDALTGSETIVGYYADVNMDGVPAAAPASCCPAPPLPARCSGFPAPSRCRLC